MGSSATYEIVYIMADGTIAVKVRTGAPSPTALFRGAPKVKNPKPIFVTRYFPSKNAWRVYDLRQFQELQFGHLTRIQPSRYIAETPDRDAAITCAILRL